MFYSVSWTYNLGNILVCGPNLPTNWSKVARPKTPLRQKVALTLWIFNEMMSEVCALHCRIVCCAVHRNSSIDTASPCLLLWHPTQQEFFWLMTFLVNCNAQEKLHATWSSKSPKSLWQWRPFSAPWWLCLQVSSFFRHLERENQRALRSLLTCQTQRSSLPNMRTKCSLLFTPPFGSFCLASLSSFSHAKTLMHLRAMQFWVHWHCLLFSSLCSFLPLDLILQIKIGVFGNAARPRPMSGSPCVRSLAIGNHCLFAWLGWFGLLFLTSNKGTWVNFQKVGWTFSPTRSPWGGKWFRIGIPILCSTKT